MLSAYATSWLTHPDGGEIFNCQRDGILRHDQTCRSLESVWLPRRGGYSCPSDFFLCDGDDCGLTFFNEGMGLYVDDDEVCPFSRHWYCHCCAAKNPVCNCKE